MESITSLLSIALGAVLVNNFVLSQFLGICPFMGVSKKVETALGMGMAGKDHRGAGRGRSPGGCPSGEGQ